MTLQDEIDAIESRVRAKGRTVRDLCIEAGVARSTWDRWRRGETEPNMKTLRQVRAAADALAPPPPPSSEDAA